MKKLIILSLLIFGAGTVFADDLTAVSIPTSGSGSTGSINLSISGGMPPFQFSWSGPSGFSAITEDISGLAAGVYTVTVTDAYCGTASLTITVTSEPPSNIANNYFQDNIGIYPNPASDYINITSNTYLKNASLRIIDITGKIVYTQKIKGQKNQVNMEPYSDGSYIIEITEDGKIARFPVVKKQ